MWILSHTHSMCRIQVKRKAWLLMWLSLPPKNFSLAAAFISISFDFFRFFFFLSLSDTRLALIFDGDGGDSSTGIRSEPNSFLSVAGDRHKIEKFFHQPKLYDDSYFVYDMRVRIRTATRMPHSLADAEPEERNKYNLSNTRTRRYLPSAGQYTALKNGRLHGTHVRAHHSQLCRQLCEWKPIYYQRCRHRCMQFRFRFGIELVTRPATT